MRRTMSFTESGSTPLRTNGRQGESDTGGVTLEAGSIAGARYRCKNWLTQFDCAEALLVKMRRAIRRATTLAGAVDLREVVSILLLHSCMWLGALKPSQASPAWESTKIGSDRFPKFPPRRMSRI